MKFPRTIQLDISDSNVYEKSALPGEWAVPASFAFLDLEPDEMTSKQRQAFGHGFLGTESFGWSTLVEVAEIDEVEFEAVVRRLANHFVDHCGAPNLDAASPFANEEANFAIKREMERTPKLKVTLANLVDDDILNDLSL